MKAMKGTIITGPHARLRLLGCVVALLSLTAIAIPSVATAAKGHSKRHMMKIKPINRTYLALGDSLAFGYSAKLFGENFPTESPSAFEHGYVNDYYTVYNGKRKGEVQLVNDGCPGETTESLIGSNPTLLAGINAALAGKIPEPVTGEAPCEYHAKGFPLHHEYGAGKSQLESALDTIALGKVDGKPVTILTLNIGANDQLHAINKLKEEVGKAIQTGVEAKAKTYAEQQVTKKVEAAAKAKVEAYVAGIAQAKVEQKVKEIAEGEVAAKVQKLAEEHIQVEIEKGELPFEEPADKEAVEKYAFEYFVGHKAELEAEGKLLGEQYFGEHYAELVAEIGKIAGEYAATHAKELEGLFLKFEGEYFAENAKKLGEEGAEIGAEYGAKYAVEHAKELEEEGNVLFGKGLEKIVPGVFEQIEVNITGILATLKGAGYHGKVIFQGGYDPYGNNTGKGEILPGSVALAAHLNAEEKTLVKKLKVKGCTTNPEIDFNPGLPEEPTRLFLYTEMHQKPADIHATPLGYQVLAEEMEKTCGS
jgi:lysophospholipase L1-like esterase